MTYRITHSITCDACGEDIFKPTTNSFANNGPPAMPFLSRYQWKALGGVFDLCDECAKPVGEALQAVVREKREQRN